MTPQSTMPVRLYWQDGRVEELKEEVPSGTTLIVRNTANGHRHFRFIEEFDEGFAIFWEDDEAH